MSHGGQGMSTGKASRKNHPVPPEVVRGFQILEFSHRMSVPQSGEFISEVEGRFEGWVQPMAFTSAFICIHLRSKEPLFPCIAPGSPVRYSLVGVGGGFKFRPSFLHFSILAFEFFSFLLWRFFPFSIQPLAFSLSPPPPILGNTGRKSFDLAVNFGIVSSNSTHPGCL
jgi:hypothetical protein